MLGLILCGAAAVRWYRIGSASFWTDEFLSLEVSAGHGYQHLDLPRGVVLWQPQDLTGVQAAGSWSEIFLSLRRSTHPPLYFCALRLWRDLWSTNDDTATRSLSALFSVLAILLAFDAARVLHASTRLGLWSAAALAVANPQIQFAQEARGYALLVTLMMVCCSALARIERLGVSRRRIAALLLGALGMILTHYMGFAILAALMMYAAICLRGAARRQTLYALTAAILIMLSIWGPFMWSQTQGFAHNLAWMKESPDGRWLRLLERLCVLPIHFFFKPGNYPGWICYGAVSLFLLPLFMLRSRPQLLLWYLIAATVVLVVAVGDLYRSSSALGIARYTLPAAAAANILAIALMAQLRGRLRWIAPSIVVLGCILALPLSYDRSKPDWRAFASYLNSECHSDSVIVIASSPDRDWYAGMLNIGLAHYAQQWNRPVVILTAPANQQVLRQLSGVGTIDIISASLPAEQLLPGCVVRDSTYFPFIGTCQRAALSATAHSNPKYRQHADSGIFPVAITGRPG